MRKFLLFVSLIVLNFTVFAQAPTISSFSPRTAEVGASVNITGTNFDATAVNNVVYFGSVRATVTASTTTSLTVTVPKSSTYSQITVISNSLIVKSIDFFRVINNSIAANAVANDKFGSNIAIASTSGYQFNFKDMYIAVGDFDNDGMVDVVKGGSSQVRVHRNLMTGPSVISTTSFSSGNNFTVSGQPSSIIIEDINADGKLDIISGSSSGVSVLINNSTGTGSISFASAVNLAGSYADVVRASDFDLDGKLDLVTIRSTSVAIYRNISTSSFTLAAAQIVNIPTLINCLGLGIGDFDKDLKPDIVVSNSTATAILLNGSSVGTITFPNNVSLSGGGSTVTIGDYDNDGDPDVYLTNRIFVNNYSSGSILSSNFSTFTYNVDGGASAYSISDFNSDGKVEINGGTTWDACYTMIFGTLPITNTSLSAIGYFLSKTYGYTAGPGLGVDADGDNKVDYISAANYANIFSVTQNQMPLTPIITVTGTLSPSTICYGDNSTEQTITISGSNLTANITATAPVGYEISLTSGTGFANTLTLTKSGSTVANTTVYVRLQGTASNGASGNITLTSTGATTQNIATGTAIVNGTYNLGGSMQFNGNNQYLTVPNSSNFSPGTGDFTVEWYQNQQSSSNWPRSFSIGNTQLAADIEAGNFYLWLGGTWVAATPVTNYLNTWVHFAIVRSGTSLKVYKDGVSIISISNSSNIAFTGAFNIGAKDGTNAGESFNGYITNFRFSNAAIYTGNFTVQKSPLTSTANTKLLLLASNSGSILTDSGPGALTLTNTASTGFNASTPFNPPPGTLSGTQIICSGTSATFLSTYQGGTWSSSDLTVASINTTTGLVMGVDAGNATMTYTVTRTGGCPSLIATRTVTVNSTPTISGTLSLCAATSTTLIGSGTAASSTPWLSSSPSVATVTSSGLVSALKSGTTTITYSTSSGCLAAAVVSVTGTPGSLGSALNFDGIDDVVTIPNNAALNISNSISIEAWIKPSSGSNIQNVLSKSSQSQNTGYIFPRTDDNWANFNTYLHIGGAWKTTSYAYPNDGNFHHVAMTYDGANIKLYLDGNLVKTQPQTGALTTNTNNLALGNQPGISEFFKGTLDEVRIWNTTLTADQINARMNSELVGNETGLVLNYNFNQGISGGNNASITSESNLASTPLAGALSGFAKSGATSNYISSAVVNPIGGSRLCIGTSLQLTHPSAGGTWSIPTTSGLSISNTGALTGTQSTTTTSVVVSYSYTINTCSFTDTKTINISQVIAGTASGNQILCTSIAPSAITLVGNSVGSSIQWQESIDNSTYTNIIGASTSTLSTATIGVITGTKYYKAAVSSSLCGAQYSNIITKGYNNSLNFDGTDDYVTLPNLTNGLSSFTFESWVYPTATSDWQRIFDFGTGTTVNMFLTTSEGNTHMPRFAITNSGNTNEQKVTSTSALTQNKWNHVAVTLDVIAQEGKIYINGVLSGTASMNIDPSTLGTLTNHYFGRSNYSNDPYFKGALDNVTIWNIVRTQDQIRTDMNVALTSTEIGLVANYDFNQGIPAGTNTSIISANETKNIANNGGLVNFTKTAATSNFVDGFKLLLSAQPIAPPAICLNANSNTISATAYGAGITFQWYSNTTNSAVGATPITNATTNTYTIPTNVAGTKYYAVIVTGSCSSSVTSDVVSQVVNASTFTTDVSSASQNLIYGESATALTVVSPGATAFQWYSTPTNPSLVSGFSAGTGWTSSTGTFQNFSGNSGANPSIDVNGYLRFAYTSPSSIYKDFTLDPTATTISFSAEYASLDNNNDRGKIQLYFYNASNTQIGSVVQSADLTGTLAWQSTSLLNITIPAGATKAQVVFYQIQEYPYWAGNYGIAFRNPSVTINVALIGTAISGATASTYTPSTTTPGALYYYAVASGGCSTITSSLSGLIKVGKGTPTIGSISAINKTFGDADFTLIAPTSNATGAFTFTSSNTGVATISGTTVTIVGAGIATITATQATDANYNAGTVTTTLTVAKGIPTFGVFAAINKTVGDAAFTLIAPSSNSTGSITFTSSNTAVATISGSTVTIVGAGTANITATQATDANYSAGNVTTTLTVAKGTPSFGTFVAINKTYGNASFTLTAPSSTSSGAFSYTSGDASVATVSGSSVTIAGVGSTTITATQASDANYNAGAVTTTLTVVKGTPSFGTFAVINKTFGDAAFTVTSPSSNSTGTITFSSSNTAVATVLGSSVTIVGAGTANITATQAADANYNAASVTTILTVAKAARTLTAFADINKTTTDAPFTLVAPTSSAGTGAITYASSNSAVATVSGSTLTIIGIGTSTITATQATDANYLAATITATLTVILGDSDGDGVPDDVEIREGTNPNDPSSVKDSDGDGVPDYVEIGDSTNPNDPLSFKDSDGNGLSDYYEARNVAPTNIALSVTTVNENNAAGASISNLSATDVNIGEAFTYALITGTGSTDNASFTISGSSLKSVVSFDFETKTSYNVRIKVTDKGGLTYEKIFTILVADINEAPTTLVLTGSTVLENTASGATVGTLSATDPDANSSFTYTLASGNGSTDNGSFTITGGTLKTSAVFDFETKNTYAIRLKVTDAGGLSFEKAFTITVTDVNEVPTLVAITDRRVYNVSTSQVVNLSGITGGPETAQTTTTTVSTDKPTTFSSISVVGTQIQFTLAAGITTPQDVVVSVKVKDNGGVANGGVDTLVRTFKLGIDPLPIATGPSFITLGATAQLSATGANAINYTWVAVGGSGIVGSGANINVRPTGTTTYAVVVTNSFGYQATIPLLLTVIADYKLVPANVITPNGDGVNDKWIIPNIDMYPDNEVKVFDKAGQVVYTKRGYANDWDGTLNGKKLKEDAYLYIIKFNKDGVLPIRGYLTIVR